MWTPEPTPGIVDGVPTGPHALPDAPWHRLPRDERAPNAARRFVTDWLTERGAGPAVIDDLALAASELVANVVQHGDTDEVRLRLDDGEPASWTLEVAGGRRPLPAHLTDPARWAVAPPQHSHGRGLGIVRAVVDDADVLSLGDEWAIRCRRARA